MDLVFNTKYRDYKELLRSEIKEKKEKKMKSLFKVLMITLVAVSAFAGSVQELKYTNNQPMLKGIQQDANSETRNHEAGALRDLRDRKSVV